MKYTEPVHVVTRKHLSEAVQSYPDAANDIKAWLSIVGAIRWHSFEELRRTFQNADLVDGYVIFNIRHNRYRLVTVVHYAKTSRTKQTVGHVYIRSFLTHKEYDNRNNWDRRYGKK
ncbi:MAG TPA: type II toxin-antitoxin system HigB family toxin [Candidatus Sulfotelmatobacter sp.]|nr:type II toxin-antitoxin system HigB family toxin [Candidatus Sulfotelmatobacter sp.]